MVNMIQWVISSKSQNIRTDISAVQVKKKHEIVNECVGEWVYPIGGKGNKVGQL